MGSQVSTIKAAAGKKFAAESKKKGHKVEKAKIGILAFEVANVMSKSIQLWQSLSDHEILRLRTEVIKAEGVLNLVSDNEAILLSLACMEKLQDLTAVASAVARLGQRCQEPALQGFEHVYNDVLEQSIDVRPFEFSFKEMEGKMKKMERYIASTATLYQQLEILADLEQSVHRMQEQEEVAHGEMLSSLEQKATWQRQEIKYVRDSSLWNHTYDKIVGLLARTVCTIHRRIIGVFGSPMLGLLPAFPHQHNGPHINQRRNSFVCYLPNIQNAPCAPSSVSLDSENTQLQFFERPLMAIVQAETTDSFTSALLYATSHSIQPGQSQHSVAHRNGHNVRVLCDPKSRHQMAPWSTLGGAALALHYANVIIILERMVRYPYPIDRDARDDLYQMLPKSVRGALRSRLRASMRSCDNGKSDSGVAMHWKEALDRLLSWLAPLAHNMIKWQSEHNFEQQQVVARTNVLLLQTLYFADLAKTESAITELLVGLNYITGLEQEMKSNSMMTEDPYTKQQEETEECLDWQI
ncbi:unnamed protein product [Sphagnum jensenii]|uniref:Uncharacterized protein n=1 Tax=Sphagnum jensenii TaxID=128206 RepID=A0ABP1A8X3_9BRYO